MPLDHMGSFTCHKKDVGSLNQGGDGSSDPTSEDLIMMKNVHRLRGDWLGLSFLGLKTILKWNFGILNQGFGEFLVILLDVCMINILAWNIRRVIGWTMYCLIKDLIIKYHIDLMALFETKVNDNKVDVILSHLRLDYWFKVDTLGFFSGIWLLWDSSIIYVVVRHDNLIGPRKYSSNFPRFWWKTCFDRGWGSCFPELMKSSSIVSSLNLNGVVCMTHVLSIHLGLVINEGLNCGPPCLSHCLYHIHFY